MKACSKCQALKTLDLFAVNKQGKFGRHSVCKECMNSAGRIRHDPVRRSETNSAWYKANRESVLARTTAWRKQNLDLVAGYSRAWRANNPEKQHAATMSWRKRNPETQALHYQEKDFRRRSKGYSSKRSEVRSAIMECKESYRIGDKYIDAYTMELIDSPTIDHIIPLAAGGSNDVGNFVLTSRANNSSKRDGNLIGFLWRLRGGGM